MGRARSNMECLGLLLFVYVSSRSTIIGMVAMRRSYSRSLALLLAFAPALIAQAPTSVQVQQAANAAAQANRAQTPFFTADDALDINTYAIADMTDDGKSVALTH